jgi:hypothetical protein
MDGKVQKRVDDDDEDEEEEEEGDCCGQPLTVACTEVKEQISQ